MERQKRRKEKRKKERELPGGRFFRGKREEGESRDK